MPRIKKTESTNDNNKSRRTPKRLSHTLYSYVEPINGKYARTFGKESFGSFSNYLDILIAADRKNGYTKQFIKKTKTTPITKAV